MPPVIPPQEVKDRLARRTGRTIQAMNAIGDVLMGYQKPGYLSQDDFEQVIMELEEKLNALKSTPGYKPVPYNKKTQELREALEGTRPFKPFETEKEQRKPGSVNREPSTPRMPKARTFKNIEDGSGLPFDDL